MMTDAIMHVQFSSHLQIRFSAIIMQLIPKKATIMLTLFAQFSAVPIFTNTPAVYSVNLACR